MAQNRKWSVVIHDVPPQAKELCHSVLKKLGKSYIIALEPYDVKTQTKPSPTGFHLHLFYELKSPSIKSRELKKWEGFKWGRVQVDPQLKHATDADREVYLTNPGKRKDIDPSPIIFPNTKSSVCQCKEPELYRAQLRSFQRYEDTIKTLVDMLFISPNQITDFDKFEEELEYKQQCRWRCLELLMQYKICPKCVRPRQFFYRPIMETTDLPGDDDPPRRTVG